MSKPKTKKFYIESVLADGIMSNKIEVTESKFKKALADMEAKWSNQDSEEGDEFYINRFERNYDEHNCQEKRIEFNYSIDSIYFIALSCKEGYCFK